MLSVLGQLSPTLMDRLMLAGDQGARQQQASEPDDGQDGLFAPVPGPGRIEGDFGHLTKSSSLYTRYLELYPNRKRVALGAALVGGLALVRRLAR